MSFTKSFPRTLKGSNYPIWEEISLSAEQEKEVALNSFNENLVLMKKCLDEAKKVLSEKDMKDYQSDVVSLAVALFEKTASHSVYHKEAKARELFNDKFK